MDMILRVIAIIIELVILTAITYAVLNGVRLTVFDLGIGPKYSKIAAILFLTIGIIVVVFFIAHLTTFYPTT
jgi:succinate dehydrogenase/fumarate reductase cytochrome b subunit